MVKYCQKGPLPLAHAAYYFYQMLQVIAYLHSQGFVHRDVKLDNFCVAPNCIDPSSDFFNIKMIDFGFARKQRFPDLPMIAQKGTPQYVSPEVVDGLYYQSTDIWSLGVIFYIFLYGRFPIAGTHEAVYEHLRHKKGIEFEKNDAIIPEAYDLLSRLMDYNQETRITAQEALNHPFFETIFSDPDSKLVPLNLSGALKHKALAQAPTGISRIVATAQPHEASTPIRCGPLYSPLPGLEIDKIEDLLDTNQFDDALVMEELELVKEAMIRFINLNPVLRSILVVATFYVPEIVQCSWESIYLAVCEVDGSIDTGKFEEFTRLGIHEKLSFTEFLASQFMQGHVDHDQIHYLNQAIITIRTQYEADLQLNRTENDQENMLPRMLIRSKSKLFAGTSRMTLEPSFYHLTEDACVASFGETVFGQSTREQFRIAANEQGVVDAFCMSAMMLDVRKRSDTQLNQIYSNVASKVVVQPSPCSGYEQSHVMHDLLMESTKLYTRKVSSGADF